MSRKVSLRIHYDRRSDLVALLTLALLVMSLLGYLAWGQHKAIASGLQASLGYARGRLLTSSAGLRRYYLTKTSYNGADADGVCASGYHMASLWEILDPSNLVYNTALGDDRADSGEGPQTCLLGWVRTGYNGDNSDTPGNANCNVWSETTGYGTTIGLPSEWTDTATQDIHVWDASIRACSNSARVWCVEDIVRDGTYEIYMPVILKSQRM